ncbi:MAG: hypothetical protein ACRD1Y_05985 [Terriglobales bacterium]
MPPASRLRCFSLALLCLGVLAACGRSQPQLARPAARLHGPHLWVYIAPEANQNSPVAVDFAVPTDKKLLKLLVQEPVAQWFAHRTQWELDNPGVLTVLSWQWVPGQTIAPIPLRLPHGAQAVVVFANYHDPKAKPLVLIPGGHGLSLDLLAQGPAGHAVR